MNRPRVLACIVVGSSLAACHDGGWESGSPPPPAVQTYTIGGTVNGLVGPVAAPGNGSGPVLRNNGVNELLITDNGAFTFPARLPTGAAYGVAILAQPFAPTQGCFVAHGSGVVAAANVTNVIVTCTTRSFTVGGTVSGLTGTGLTLRDAINSPPISVRSGSATFQFPLPVASGRAYSVRITAQPTGTPEQVCTVVNGGGVVEGADVASISVVCNSGAAKFVYVPDAASNNVMALRVDLASGALSAVPGSPFATSVSPQAMIATPGGRFLYVQSASAGLISGFAVDASGALTPAPGSPFTVTGGSASRQLQSLDTTGRFLYVQRSPTPLLYGHAIDPTTGALTAIPGSPFEEPQGVAVLIFDPLGLWAYSLGGGPAGLSIGNQIDWVTGALSPFSFPLPTVTETTPIGVVHPGGAFVYNIEAIRVYLLRVDLSVGALTSVSTHFTAGGRYARIDPLGRFLYMTGGNSVVGFTISPQNGVLSPIPGSPFDAGTQTESFDIDPSGTYLYVPAVLGQQLSGFRIDATTGALSQVPGSPIVFGAGTNPNVARVDKSGRSLFVSSSGDNKIRKFSVAPADGSLTLVSTVSVPTVGSSGFLLVGTQ